MQRVVQSFGKVNEAAAGVTLVGKFEQFFLRIFYLFKRVGVKVFFGSLVYNFKSGIDEFAPQIFVINKLSIIFGIGQRRGAVGKLHQIFVAANLVQQAFLLKIVFQRNNVGDVALADEFGNNVINFGMDRVGKMFRS